VTDWQYSYVCIRRGILSASPRSRFLCSVHDGVDRSATALNQRFFAKGNGQTGGLDEQNQVVSSLTLYICSEGVEWRLHCGKRGAQGRPPA